MRARGNPFDGAIIASGAVIDIAEPWASRFIEDGTAVLAEPEKPKAEKAEKPKEPKAKGK